MSRKDFLIRVPEDRVGLYECIQYPAGELQVRLTEKALLGIEQAPGVAVLCRTAHADIMELALLVDAINRVAEFKEVQLVLPYLPYARADRRFVEGDCHGLHAFGKMLDTMLVDHVVTLDVHSPKASQHTSRLRNVSPTKFIQQAYASVREAENHLHPTILLPDEGSLTRYDLPLNWKVEHCKKVRDSKTGGLSGFEVPYIVTSSVLIVDDICDGGGTFIGIAEKLPKGVKKYLYVTHGIFSKGLGPLMAHFKHIFVTDSYPHGRGTGGETSVVTLYNALELL